MTGYAAAILLGMIIVLTTIQFRNDVSEAFNKHGNLSTTRYVEITRPTVSFVADRGFSAEEIADIASQPWAERVGAFESARFNVTAAIDMGGRGLSTALFLESVPDDFLDTIPPGWHYDPEHDAFLPVILSRDYLTLYNLGFAATQGLPQVSETLATSIPLRIIVRGNGLTDDIPARIVAFSDRLNTVAVPTDFMTRANKRYAADDPGYAPRRLIVELNTDNDPTLSTYLEQHGYQTGSDNAPARAGRILDAVTSATATTGIVICILAACILLLSVSLLLQKSANKLQTLFMLGYSPSQVARYYYTLVATLNLLLTIVAICAVITMRGLWIDNLHQMGIATHGVLTATVSAVILYIAFTAVNLLAIRHKLIKLWKHS